MACIYIAWDPNKPDLAKVGMTTKKAASRISQTENPDYELYKDYEVDTDVVAGLEQDIHLKLGKLYKRKAHAATGRNSEWFECTPAQALEVVSDQIILYLNKKLLKYENSPQIVKKYSPLINQTEKPNRDKLQELKIKLRQRAEARKNGTLEDEVHFRQTILNATDK